MAPRNRVSFSVAIVTAGMLAAFMVARPAADQGQAGRGAAPPAQRVVHTDPAAFRASPAVHAGAGSMAFTGLLGRGVLGPHFNFLHRGEIPVGSASAITSTTWPTRCSSS